MSRGITISTHALVRALFVAGAVCSLLPWLLTDTNPHGAGNAVTAVGRTAGLLAIYLVLVQLVLLARVPALERAVGFGRLTAWHRTLGTTTILLIAAHFALVIWGYALTDHRGVLGEAGTVISTYPAMIRAVIAGGLFLLVGLTSQRFLRTRMPYEVWWLTHLLVYAGVILNFAHQVENGEQFVGHPLATDLLRVSYLAVLAAVIWWRVLEPLRAAFAQRFAVQDVRPEGAGAVSITIGGAAVERLAARPGQFVMLRFLTRGLWTTAHPYSLSEPVAGGRLRVTVAGNDAVARLRPGTRAIVEGPFGAFVTDPARTGTPALLVGGGAGISPLRAIAEELSERGREVVVVQRARTEEHLYLGAELAALPRVRLEQLVGRRQDLGHDPLRPEALVGLVPDIADRDVWICGPPGMTWTVIAACRALGVPDAHLNVEEFEL